MRKHFKTRFPALNLCQQNEPVATDTIFSNIPAICTGHMAAQIFVGCNSLLGDAYGCSTDSQFSQTLEDNICQWGAMDLLISDRALSQISKKVQYLIRAYIILYLQS